MLFKLLCNRYTDNGTLCDTCTLFIYQYAPIRGKIKSFTQFSSRFLPLKRYTYYIIYRVTTMLPQGARSKVSHSFHEDSSPSNC